MDEVSAEVAVAAGRLRACLGPLVRRLRQVQVKGELNLSQIAVLGRLERDGPATPGELAGHEQIRPQSMASILSVLGERGLVSRRPDPVDGRRVVVSITPTGRDWVTGLRQERAQELAGAIASGLTAAEQEQLFAAIPLLERLGQMF